MGARLCTHCESRGGLPHMIETSRQKFVSGVQPEVIEWRCPVCGYTTTETNYYEPSGGTYNSGVGYVMEDNAGPSNP